MKNRVFYFAYGLYMNPAFMKECCPHATPLYAATLRRHRITERRYADLDPDRASDVHGILYAITSSDWKNLILYYVRGLKVFEAKEIVVEADGRTFNALTCAMTPEGKKACDGLPFRYGYLRDCRRGALYYMIPNAYRYANVFVYGTRMSGGKDDSLYTHAATIKPCTLKGTLYDSGYGYPLFTPEGDTAVEAEYLRVPWSLWGNVLSDVETSPFKADFLVGTEPDGRTLGGWSVCLKDMPPRARIIESGSWRARRKLKFDTLKLTIRGEGCDTRMLIDFSSGVIYGKMGRLSPDDPDGVETEGVCHLGRYWRNEILKLLRECSLERWPEACYSNGEGSARWVVELKNDGERVRLMAGQNVYPLNWDVFRNMIGLCFRLCGKNAIPQEMTGAQQSPDEEKGNGNDAPATPPAPEPVMVEPELPLFDDDVPYSASGLLKGEKRDDAATAATPPSPASHGPEPDKPAEQDSADKSAAAGTKESGHDDLCPDPPPPPPDKKDRK